MTSADESPSIDDAFGNKHWWQQWVQNIMFSITTRPGILFHGPRARILSVANGFIKSKGKLMAPLIYKAQLVAKGFKK